MQFDSVVKFLGSQKFIILIVLLILILGFFFYSKSKMSTMDYMSQGSYSSSSSANNYAPFSSSSSSSGNSQFSTPEIQNFQPTYTPPSTVTNQVVQKQDDYSMQPVANPSDLLPADKNSQWSTLNPSLSQNNVIVPDLLEAGYHIGLDTIGQTLRNANLQERSDPIIPKQDISPWNNSTIEPDLGRVPLELGYGCR